MFTLAPLLYGGPWRPLYTEPALTATQGYQPELSFTWLAKVVELNRLMQTICLRETGERWPKHAAWFIWMHFTPSSSKAATRIGCTTEERDTLYKLSYAIGGWCIRPILGADLKAVLNSYVPWELWCNAYLNPGTHRDNGELYF